MRMPERVTVLSQMQIAYQCQVSPILVSNEADKNIKIRNCLALSFRCVHLCYSRLTSDLVPREATVISAGHNFRLVKCKTRTEVHTQPQLLRPEGYKTFCVHNSVEHEIFSANKYENANNSWHFHIYQQRNFHAYCPFDISQKDIFGLAFYFKWKILFWMIISYQKPFVFSVSVYCSQIFIIKLNLRPKIGLTYVISIVKWFFGFFVSENIFHFSLLDLNYWCFTTTLWKFQKQRQAEHWKSATKLPTL